MSADFWTMLELQKTIARQELADRLGAAAALMADKGCVDTRATRINGPASDAIWIEGWLAWSEMPHEALDPETLLAERRV